MCHPSPAKGPLIQIVAFAFWKLCSLKCSTPRNLTMTAFLIRWMSRFLRNFKLIKGGLQHACKRLILAASTARVFKRVALVLKRKGENETKRPPDVVSNLSRDKFFNCLQLVHRVLWEKPWERRCSIANNRHSRRHDRNYRLLVIFINQ